jgi:hypothetical protein
LLSSIEADIQVHPVLADAVLILSFPVSKCGVRGLYDCAIKLSDPENMEVIGKMYFLT